MDIQSPAKLLILEAAQGSLEHIESLISIFGTEYDVSSIAVEPEVFDVLKVLKQQYVDLILIDDRLSKKTCHEICMKIRQNDGCRHTGIIFVSMNSGDSSNAASSNTTLSNTTLIECLELGADDFVANNSSERELLARIRAVLRLKSMTDELRKANHKLTALSLTDELTGLANMRSFNQKYQETLRECAQGECSVAVIMTDLDKFKKVNDTHNHLVGSSVISEMGHILKERVGLQLQEGRDLAARYGGDEYVIMIKGAHYRRVKAIVEAINSETESFDFKGVGKEIRITASVGAVWVASGYRGNGDALIKIADDNLYRSKAKGRNCYTISNLGNTIDLDYGERPQNTKENSADHNQVTASGRISITKKTG